MERKRIFVSILTVFILGCSWGETARNPLRYQLGNDLEKDAAVVIPIYHYAQNQAVSARVKNYRVNPFGDVLFSGLLLK